MESRWSIYGRAEITARYEVIERAGSGAYSDVYRGRRLADNRPVALKEVHDHRSASREIEALLALRGAPGVVEFLEYFWSDDDEPVLVLEFLHADLSAVIRSGKRNGGIPVPEVKRWMFQIVEAVDACHRSGVVHRDLKPANLMISAEGVLKIVDFGQARILQEARFTSGEANFLEQIPENEALTPGESVVVPKEGKSWLDRPESQTIQEQGPIYEDEYLQEIDGLKTKYAADYTDNEISLQDGNASCLATCSTGDMEDDPFKNSLSYEVDEGGLEDETGALTTCVGTRWYKAPELFYGSTSYGEEIDLWSLGCILAELLSLQTLFPGTSDIEQLGKIINVLGNLNEETWPGCSKLPSYHQIFFGKVENPIGLEACLPNRSASEVNLIRKLVCYDPARRATAMELLQDRYFEEDPLPAPLNELTIPSTKDGHDESSPAEWGDYRDMGSDSDFEEFGRMDVTTTEKGFSIRFS